MKIKKGFVVRSVGGEYVVVPVGALSKTFRGMINLNETGAFLWRFFSEEKSRDEAVAALKNEYDADEETLAADVDKFMEILTRNGFVE